MTQSHFWSVPALLLVIASSTCANEKINPTQLTFEKDVRPIFKAMCFDCHGEGKRLRGQLDLRLRRLMIEGGESGPTIVPKNVNKSILLHRLDKQEMPPGKKKLTPEQVKIIRQWIAQGASTARPEPKEIQNGMLITEEERNHWAFQPIREPKLPTPANAQDARTPIDLFILRKLHEQNLEFSSEADRSTLIRRVTINLLGIPPTPEEVDAFVQDPSPNAWETLIDRLLASPEYGERWGRHWLDVAGYADSEGYSSEDPERPYAWKYRDYVIDAFNKDKPFDQFIQEQLAGDEMIGSHGAKLNAAQLEKMTATGFLRMAPDGTGTGGVDQPLARNQVVAETLNIVTTSMMGMTVGCAQCHNHRYDPIPQTDYYRIRAIFEPALDPKNWRSPNARRLSLYTAEDKKRAAEIEAEAKKIDQTRLKKQEEYIQRTFDEEVAKLPENLREKARLARKAPVKKRTAEQKKLLKDYPSLNVSAGSLYLYDRKAADDLKKYTARSDALRAKKPKQDYVRVLNEIPDKVPDTFRFERGDHEQPKEKLTPGGLTILTSHSLKPIPVNDKALSTTGRRLAFARRLTDGNHPLTARVIVNRLWMHHFGRGLVNTPADFGTLGETPTHPELLDWLAKDFMNSGWQVKRLHRLILLSRTYRQQARLTNQLADVDPDNRWYGRMLVQRLEAEAVRDSILSVSGSLLSKRFGKPVPVTVDLTGQVVIGVDTRDGAGRPTGKKVPLHGEEERRSAYVQVRRSLPLGVLETFDRPLLAPNCEKRNSSTVAPQSLLLMNSALVTKYSMRFAQRLKSEVGEDREQQVRRAWKLAYGESASASDVEDALEFLEVQTKTFVQAKQKNPADQALASFCQALLSSNRFLYVD